MPPRWWPAALAVASTAFAVLVRLAPTRVAPQAMLTTLFLATAAIAYLKAARTRGDLVPAAAAVAAGAAASCGMAAGELRWPTSDAGWLFALTYAWLSVQVAHLAAALRPGAGPILAAQTLPYGLVVYGASRTCCAWLRPDGAIATALFPAGLAGSLQAHLALASHALLAPLVRLRRPVLLNVRRLHAAEHLAVLEAMKGGVPEPPKLRGNPITPLCGGTVAAIAMPAYAAVSVMSPPSSQAVALLWALCVAYALRAAATSTSRLRWLLLPGLWLQRLTTSAPGRIELELASAAVAACTGSNTTHQSTA